jgi:uncharacterized protein YggE
MALAAVAVLATGAVMLPARSAQAQDEAPATPVANTIRTITVVGEGKVDVQPDVAYLNLGVVVTRDTVREASDANQAQIDAVISAVQDAGIAEEDIQTSNFSVNVNNYGPNGILPESEWTYQVSNNVNVTIRDLASVSSVIDTAIEAGANNIYGVNFALQDSAAAQSEARAAAVEDANARAADLASLTGVTLGEIISASEVIGSQPVYGSFRENAMGMGGGGTPIQPGQLDLTMQLQVVYAIASDGGE